jgi:hypothetical protein
MDRPDPAFLAGLLRSPAPLDRIFARCWPGGGDRTEPAAIAWVRGWGPARSGVRVPECACAAGRCSTCN